MLGELPKITALKLKKGCRIFLLPNKHHPQCHIPFTSWNIQHVRNSKPKQMEGTQRLHTAWYPKRNSALHHTTSSIIYWACRNCLYFLQRRNEHRKLTHIFCQLPSRVNPQTCFGKWILETCGLSVPRSITQIIYCEYEFILHCWIKASMHPQSTNLLDRDGYSCWPVPPTQKYHNDHSGKCNLPPARD